MISLYTGSIGSGKCYHAEKRIKQLIKHGKDVISNNFSGVFDIYEKEKAIGEVIQLYLMKH